MSIQENIHNYYEKLVADTLAELQRQAPRDAEEIEDIACVALNRLPPRYFRHEIDMAFYLSPTEQQEMKDKVDDAIAEAITYVEKSHRDKD
ncbi:competence protein ComFB [Motiliproteus coralliicola]|uniref:Competence protein ComFB n=1 Tax=Motiliproteus coralliicola TaxID=2283196 RepID=A0A369WZH3_9GAMM|nr:late competence development ComFB family protein [Motiliproteus coralliicola]RDE24915.1 competence protein ComFB [Motiliproteus coralliicola]